MPSREEMIEALANAKQTSVPARVGAAAGPSREQMIEALANAGLPDDSYKSGLEKGIERATTAARSFTEGLTFGASEPVLSGIQAVTDAATGADSVGDFFDKIPEKYRSDVANRREMKARYQAEDVGGNLAGAFAPLVASFGASAPATAARIGKALDVGGRVAAGTTKVVRGATNLALGAEKAKALADSTSLGARLARTGLAATEGAASGLTGEAVRQGILKTSGHMKEGEGPGLGEAALLGAKFGGGVHGLVEGVGAAAHAIPAIGKKAMTVMLGPSGEAIEAYLKDSKRINAAKSVEEIKTELDQTVQKLIDDVDSAKLSHQQAKDTLKGLENEFRAAKADAGIDFERSAFGYREQFQNAKQKLDDSFRASKEGLQAVRAPIHMAGDVQAAIGDLKQQVIKGSNEAYDILGRTEGMVNLHGPFKLLEPIRASLSIAGKGPVTAQARAAAAELDGLINSVGQLPAKMTFKDAKALIQQLDRAEKMVRSSGEFSDEVAQGFAALRRGVDEQLKQIPAYAEKMHEVAGKTKLLSGLNERFGDQQTAISRLNSIGRNTNAADRTMLAELGKHTGQDFVTGVDQYVAAQGKLSNPAAMRQMQRELPEYKDFRVASIANERMKNPDARRSFVETSVGKTGLVPKMEAARGEILSTEERLAQAEAARDPFKTLTPTTSQSKIQSTMRDPKTQNIETRNMLAQLGERSGKDFLSDIEARRIADQFSRNNTNGSRNVVGYSTILGFLTGGWGAIPGAALGWTVDKFGPQIAQKMLDQIIKAKGSPTIQKIQGMELPQEVKDFLASALTKEAIESARNRAIQATDARGRLIGSSLAPEKEKGSEKWARDGAEKLRKHGLNIDASTADQKMKDLLIRASDLSPNSKAMQNVVTQINRLKKGGE